ncbi:MAG: DnaJ domain-containing protein [Alphaproteobacteria bacterium]|nr:DnaJ domain-containing protein [Alphaproteobacteria bacterium]
MSIWGKLAGAAAGVALGGGPLGALIGAFAGHFMIDRAGHEHHDRERHEKNRTSSEDAVRSQDQIAFTIAVIALAAKLAKADGTVTRDEVDMFKRVFPIPPEEEGNVGQLFNLAKQDVAGFEAYAKQAAYLFRARPGVLEDLLDSLFLIARADGNFHPGEQEYLHRVAEIFGLSEDQYQRIRAAHFGPDKADPYFILSVDRSISNDDLKRAYHKLVKENHPDSLTARGVPPEFVRTANERLATINAAYERICRERGIS